MSNIKGTIGNAKDYLCGDIVNVKIVNGEETAFVLEKDVVMLFLIINEK